MRRLLLLIVVLLLSACASTPHVGERPLPLPANEALAAVRVAWFHTLKRWDDLPKGRLVPVIDGDSLYLMDGSGTLSAYQADNGRYLWHHRTRSQIDSGVAAGGGLLLLGTGAQVLAYSPERNMIAWRANMSSEVLVAPTVADGMVLVRTADGKVHALDVQDGRRRWVLERAVPVLSLRGTGKIVVADNKVYAGFANGKLTAVSLQDGSLLWETAIAVPRGRSELDRIVDVDADPAIHEGVIYAAAYQGKVAALTLANGNVTWSRELSSSMSMSVDERAVYVTDTEGQVWALDRNNGESLWKQDKLRNRKLSGPVRFGDDLVVSDYEGYLHWIAREDGRLLGRYHVDEKGLVGPPVVAGHLLYVVGKSGVIEALQMRSGP